MICVPAAGHGKNALFNPRIVCYIAEERILSETDDAGSGKIGESMSFFKKLRSDMSVNVIGGLLFLVLLFGIIVCLIGYRSFVDAFMNEYSSVTYHMAESAGAFVNGDHIDEYLAGEEKEEYDLTKNILDVHCTKLNVSLIYVIKVDTSDYGRFVSVFNSVNNEVDNSGYTEWELGYKRDATNDEYRRRYRAIYEQGSEYETIFRLRPSDGAHPHMTTLVPVKDVSGETAAILCIQRPVSEMQNALRPYLLLILAGVVLMVLAVSFLVARFLRKAVIDPVEKVSKEAARFAKEHALGEPLGEISRFDEMHELAASIDSMETDMVNYIQNLTAVTSEREKMSAELSIAAMIQSDALPDDFPAFPDRQEFDLYALMDPAREVGGDFYNFFLIDEDHLALVMADVSGKGIPGALFMMVTNILLSDRINTGEKPSEVLASMNDGICEHNQADMFETVWLGILEISTGKIIAANAGHEYPAICRKDGSFELFRDKHGFVLGGMPGMKYKDYELQLGEGDKLFVYTDGLPEATDIENRMLGTEGMIDALNSVKEGSPKEIIEGVQKTVEKFVGVADQFDDLTMLCIEMKKITGQAGDPV